MASVPTHAVYDDEVSRDRMGGILDALMLPVSPERMCTCYALVVCANCRAWRKAHPQRLHIEDTVQEPTDPATMQAELARHAAQAKALEEARDALPQRTPARRFLTNRLARERKRLTDISRALARKAPRQRAYRPRTHPQTQAEVWALEDAALEALDVAVTARDAHPPRTAAFIDAQAQVRIWRQKLRTIRHMKLYTPRRPK